MKPSTDSRLEWEAGLKKSLGAGSPVKSDYSLEQTNSIGKGRRHYFKELGGNDLSSALREFLCSSH